MSTRRYVGIALAYANEMNPEPGVRRAPTIDEQTRALTRAATSQGGELVGPVLVARQGVGLESDVLDAISGSAATGAYLLTIDVLRIDQHVDELLLRRIWELTGRVDLLIEDVHIVDDVEFHEYLDMVRAVNEVRARDSAPEWLELVDREVQP